MPNLVPMVIEQEARGEVRETRDSVIVNVDL